MKISFVIPAYNEEKYIAKCLENIVALGPDPWIHEIIVVDNGSTDRTAEIAASFAGVTVVHEPRKGIAQARQCALNIATGKLLACIDADTIIAKDWLEIVKHHFENQKIVCLIGTYLYFDLAPWKRWILGMIEKTTDIVLAVLKQKYSYPRGGNSVYVVSALRAVGGFNTSIDYFGEDVDTMLRIQKMGTILHDKTLVALSSARRINAEGFWKMIILYKLNAIWQQLIGKPLLSGKVPDWR